MLAAPLVAYEDHLLPHDLNSLSLGFAFSLEKKKILQRVETCAAPLRRFLRQNIGELVGQTFGKLVVQVLDQRFVVNQAVQEQFLLLQKHFQGLLLWELYTHENLQVLGHCAEVG